MPHLRRAAAPTLIAGALAIANLILAPRTGDLVAATYRSNLFARAGFTIFDTAWYGGHHMLGYSLLAPALGALLSPRVLGAVSVVLASALFSGLVRERAAALWFATAFGVLMVSNRIPFELGVAIGVATVLAAAHGRTRLAWVLALATAVASPIAGLFIGLVGLAWKPARGCTVAALGIIALLAFAFPEGGYEPFAAGSFYPQTLMVAILFFAVGSEYGAVRRALAFYMLACLAAFALHTPVGGNAERLGELFAGPLAIELLASWHRRRLVLLSLPLIYWVLAAPVGDLSTTFANDSLNASYYRPLLGFLATQGTAPFRIEIPFTRVHWEAVYVAQHYSLARGWERQLDTKLDGIFYGAPLSAASYRYWLDTNAVRFVALPDAPLDPSSRAEGALIRTGLPYLVPVWSSPHWRVYAVSGATPMASAPATLTQLGTQSFTLRFARPGISDVRVRYTPFWAPHGACVTQAPGGFTRVSAREAGVVRVGVRFSLAQVVAPTTRCG